LTRRDAKKLLCSLLLFELFLVMVYILDSLVGVQSPIHKLFNLDSESTIPAWFSSMQLCLVGILFLCSWVGAVKQKADSRLFFLMVGLGFLFLSMDEAAEFHEKLTRVLTHIEWLPQFTGGLWIPLYLSALAIFGIAGRRLIAAIWKAYPHESLVVAAGFAIILVGSVGLEIITHLFWKDGNSPVLYRTEVVFEEFFEMAGTSVVLYGALLYALRTSGSVVVPKAQARLQPGGDE